ENDLPGQEKWAALGEPECVVAPARNEIEVRVDAALAVEQQRARDLDNRRSAGPAGLDAPDDTQGPRRWHLGVGVPGVDPVDPGADMRLRVTNPEGIVDDLVRPRLRGLAERNR